MASTDVPKKEKKTRAQIFLLISPPPGLHNDTKISSVIDGEIVNLPWEMRLATPQMTMIEKDKTRRMYRKEYMKKPSTIEKVRERMNNPTVIQKRKEYSERPEVKLRKKELAARSRAIRRELKESQPENYESIRRKIEEELSKNEEFVAKYHATPFNSTYGSESIGCC